MDSQENEITLRSVDERIKQAIDPFLMRVEELFALSASRVDLESTGNSEATSFRCDNTSASPSGNRHDTEHLLLFHYC